MFILSELEEVVRIDPSDFKRPFHSALEDQLNSYFANKVIANVGLGIALFDILKADKSFVLPGDGAHHTKVTFRYVVFRPQIGEVLTGKVKSCSPEGICVTLGFFDDILIPASGLQHPSVYKPEERMWVWAYENEDGDCHNLPMDPGEKVKFRVIAEKFNEPLPTDSSPQNSKSESKAEAPYMILGTMNEPGLGVLSWWAGM